MAKKSHVFITQGLKKPIKKRVIRSYVLSNVLVLAGFRLYFYAEEKGWVDLTLDRTVDPLVHGIVRFASSIKKELMMIWDDPYYFKPVKLKPQESEMVQQIMSNREFEQRLGEHLKHPNSQRWFINNLEIDMKTTFKKDHPLRLFLNKYIEVEKNYTKMYFFLGIFIGVFSCVFFLSISVTFKTRKRDFNLVSSNLLDTKFIHTKLDLEIKSSILYFFFFYFLTQYVVFDSCLQEGKALNSSNLLDIFNLNPSPKRKGDLDAFIGFNEASFHEII